MDSWRRNRSAQRHLLALALWAVLAVQWLALGHAVRHAGPAATAAVVQGSHEVLGGEHDAGGPVCQLLDHLLSGQGVASDLAAFQPPFVQAVLPNLHASDLAGASASAYLARAPPRAA